ncbi:DNA mismatch repair endonuclease MutH [Paraglaciecola hydrolytica]|uniref:DNA mismatch repair protein MutH n=1 Tax=Paraglaciecola hydrolytica TaxID=1799789 RepID=A0A135ZZB2_9ALTE|nr:DNA mismatch repair endonuclease MutH [Paraglaciecola hydrolytica]KXI28326.1 DNA mismatch repair protein MutH [Paraglaciecola hydrolytica]
MLSHNSEPQNLNELMTRAAQIAGLTLGELATKAGIKVPANFKREKGWTGQLLELCLGASAGSKSQQDFAHLGIELKTIPIDMRGKPLETTYVCYAHLTHIAGIEWHNCNVKNKLKQVLWVPIDGRRDIAPKDRIIATPFLWSPSVLQDQQLRQDWEELMELIALGKIENITARHGQFLQLRPKAADGRALTDAIGPNGTIIQTRPRGFYLRKEFTQQILTDAFR